LLARVRCTTRPCVEVLHRSGAHEAMVGSQGLQGACVKNGSARRRDISLRNVGARRLANVGQVRLSRNRPAGASRLHQLVFRREGRHHSPPGPYVMAARDAFHFHLRGTARRQTKFTISWEPHNATGEERQTFEAGRDSMRMGWSGTLEKLEAYLAKAK